MRMERGSLVSEELEQGMTPQYLLEGNCVSLFPGDQRGPRKHRDAEVSVLLKLPPSSGPTAPPAALSHSQLSGLVFAFTMPVIELRNEFSLPR